MKIKALKMYQTVKFQGKERTHFNAEQPLLSGIGNPIELTIVDGIGVKVESDTDVVLITFNNLASIHIYKEDKKAKTKKD